MSNSLTVDVTAFNSITSTAQGVDLSTPIKLTDSKNIATAAGSGGYILTLPTMTNMVAALGHLDTSPIQEIKFSDTDTAKTAEEIRNVISLVPQFKDQLKDSKDLEVTDPAKQLYFNQTLIAAMIYNKLLTEVLAHEAGGDVSPNVVIQVEDLNAYNAYVSFGCTSIQGAGKGNNTVSTFAATNFKDHTGNALIPTVVAPSQSLGGSYDRSPRRSRKANKL